MTAPSTDNGHVPRAAQLLYCMQHDTIYQICGCHLPIFLYPALLLLPTIINVRIILASASCITTDPADPAKQGGREGLWALLPTPNFFSRHSCRLFSR